MLPLPQTPFKAAKGVVVQSWGRPYEGPDLKRFENDEKCLYHLFYPIAYCSHKTVDGCTFESRIELDTCGSKPVFKVHKLGTKTLYQGATPTRPWDQYCDQLQSGTRISGPNFFGFSDIEVVNAVRQLYDLPANPPPRRKGCRQAKRKQPPRTPCKRARLRTRHCSNAVSQRLSRSSSDNEQPSGHLNLDISDNEPSSRVVMQHGGPPASQNLNAPELSEQAAPPLHIEDSPAGAGLFADHDHQPQDQLSSQRLNLVDSPDVDPDLLHYPPPTHQLEPCPPQMLTNQPCAPATAQLASRASLQDELSGRSGSMHQHDSLQEATTSNAAANKLELIAPASHHEAATPLLMHVCEPEDNSADIRAPVQTQEPPAPPLPSTQLQPALAAEPTLAAAAPSASAPLERWSMPPSPAHPPANELPPICTAQEGASMPLLEAHPSSCDEGLATAMSPTSPAPAPVASPATSPLQQATPSSSPPQPAADITDSLMQPNCISNLDDGITSMHIAPADEALPAPSPEAHVAAPSEAAQAAPQAALPTSPSTPRQTAQQIPYPLDPRLAARSRDPRLAVQLLSHVNNNLAPSLCGGAASLQADDGLADLARLNEQRSRGGVAADPAPLAEQQQAQLAKAQARQVCSDVIRPLLLHQGKAVPTVAVDSSCHPGSSEHSHNWSMADFSGADLALPMSKLEAMDEGLSEVEAEALNLQGEANSVLSTKAQTQRLSDKAAELQICCGNLKRLLLRFAEMRAKIAWLRSQKVEKV